MSANISNRTQNVEKNLIILYCAGNNAIGETILDQLSSLESSRTIEKHTIHDTVQMDHNTPSHECTLA